MVPKCGGEARNAKATEEKRDQASAQARKGDKHRKVKAGPSKGTGETASEGGRAAALKASPRQA